MKKTSLCIRKKNSEYAPGFDAEDVGDGLDGVHHEIEGTSLMGGKCIGSAVVVDVKRDVDSTVVGEESIEVGGVDGRDCDVFSVVEEIDMLVSAGCPSVAEVVFFHCGNETLREVGLEVEHGRGDVVGNSSCMD